jgi:hypothetical protein
LRSSPPSRPRRDSASATRRSRGPDVRSGLPGTRLVFFAGGFRLRHFLSDRSARKGGGGENADAMDRDEGISEKAVSGVDFRGAEAGTNRRNAKSGPMHVAAAVLFRGGRVLVARRSPGFRHAGSWEFPGGKIEPGESPEACLAREMAEEFGIVARSGGTGGPKRFRLRFRRRFHPRLSGGMDFRRNDPPGPRRHRLGGAAGTGRIRPPAGGPAYRGADRGDFAFRNGAMSFRTANRECPPIPPGRDNPCRWPCTSLAPVVDGPGERGRQENAPA